MTAEQTAKCKDMMAEYGTASEARKLEIATTICELIADDFAPEAKLLVKRIEKDSFPLTKHNYGRYMEILSRLDGIYRTAMIVALKAAGAGPGLDSAVRVM